MIANNIRELLERDPFAPFRVVTSSGESYVVRYPHLVVLMRSEVFIAQPNSDRHTFVPLLHVSAVEMLANGHTRASQRGGKRRR